MLSISILSLLLFATCGEDEPKPPVDNTKPDTIIINEIQSTGNPDWIELYNYGEETVDLEGFKIFDVETAKYTIPSGYSINAKDYLILICDDQGTGLNMPFKLSSDGESVTLQRADGKMLDHVLFPEMKNSETYSRFPDGPAGTWKITGFATQGITNGSGPVSFFKSYSYTPTIPMVGDDINFTLEINDGSAVSKMQILYAIDEGTYSTLDMTSTDKLTWKGKVPALTSDGELNYYFKLTDNSNNTVILPDDADTDPYDITITSGPVPTLFINEYLASNTSVIKDPDGIDEYDDFIEIYNAGTVAVDMARFYFSDSEDPFDDRIKTGFPDKTTIQPGGFLLFWADSDTEQGPNHLKFKLTSAGETISLYYKDGRLIDKRSYGAQSENISEGRKPDGSNTWVKFTSPTPGQSNQ
jgi:hypothetical protein